MLKQDGTMFRILNQIIIGVKKTDEALLRKDYDLNAKQMSDVFKRLSDSGIIERKLNSFYTVTAAGRENAQELCLNEIAQRLNEIEDIAYSGDISDEMLIEFIRLHLSDRKRRGQIK